MTALEAGRAEHVDRLHRGPTGGDDVLDQTDALPRLERALEAVLGAVPFASLRTIRNGRPDASDADAASATAPSSGPARASASGSTSSAAPRAAPRAARAVPGAFRSGTCRSRPDDRRPERRTKSPSRTACSRRASRARRHPSPGVLAPGGGECLAAERKEPLLPEPGSSAIADPSAADLERSRVSGDGEEDEGGPGRGAGEDDLCSRIGVLRLARLLLDSGASAAPKARAGRRSARADVGDRAVTAAIVASPSRTTKTAPSRGRPRRARPRSRARRRPPRRCPRRGRTRRRARGQPRGGSGAVVAEHDGGLDLRRDLEQVRERVRIRADMGRNDTPGSCEASSPSSTPTGVRTSPR